jgi:16S rRNA (cytidine1402-2'-O)-methyltransferase
MVLATSNERRPASRYNTRVGTLFLVATPIGNLEDITLRALRVLSEVRLVAAEDTRQTRKLLDRYSIATPMIRYDEHTKGRQTPRLLEELAEGDVALVSDAGTPGIADPGPDLVRAALSAGYAVTSLPGPSAVAAALAGSGLPAGEFSFLGYLPRRQADRLRLLRSQTDEQRTLVAFEVPHRLRQSLADLESCMGSDRPLAVARELSKLHEEWFRGTLGQARTRWQSDEPRGEFTLVIGGRAEASTWAVEAVERELRRHLQLGETPTEAARQVAKVSGWPRRDVYRMALERR